MKYPVLDRPLYQSQARSQGSGIRSELEIAMVSTSPGRTIMTPSIHQSTIVTALSSSHRISFNYRVFSFEIKLQRHIAYARWRTQGGRTCQHVTVQLPI